MKVSFKLKIILWTVFLVGMASLFRFCSGPFYFGSNSDPSYFYLYNFLYILEGKTLEFVDHPGTTLDMLGAGIIKVFFSPLHNTPWLLSIAPHAEQILGLVWLGMVLLYALTFLVLGFYIFRKSKDGLFTGLVLLSSLWLIMVRSYFAPGILPISANVNSDTMMMSAVNMMIAAILMFYFSPKSKSLIHPIFLGGAVAFAIATKITALPFFVVALCILVTWPQRLLLGIVVTAGFVLLTWPIWGAYAHMIYWVKVLIMDRGMHGSGGVGFDSTYYVRNLFWVMGNHWFFVVVWLLAGMIAVKSKAHVESKTRRILLGLALGGLAQIIIVAKQPSYQYMAPMIGLSSLALALLFKSFPDWWQRGFKYVLTAIVMVTLVLLAVELWQVNETSRKSRQVLDIISNDYSQCWVCPFYRSSMQGFSFVFWNNVLNRDDYSSILKTYYPSMVYYDTFAKDFKDITRQIIPMRKLIQQRPCVLMYGTDADPQNFEPYLTLKKVYTNGGPESLYEVKSQRSNRAREFYRVAVIFYAQGHYVDALKALTISKQFGLEQDVSGFVDVLEHEIQHHER